MQYVIGFVLMLIVVVPIIAELMRKPKSGLMHQSAWLDARQGDDYPE